MSIKILLWFRTLSRISQIWPLSLTSELIAMSDIDSWSQDSEVTENPEKEMTGDVMK